MTVEIELVGPAGAGTRTLARQFCAALGADLLVADASLLLGGDRPLALAIERGTRAARSARLAGAILYWDNAESVDARVWRAVAGHSNLVLLGAQSPLAPAQRAGTARKSVRLPALTRAVRIALWSRLSDRPAPAAVADWLQVTLQAPGGIFHVGDYWLIAVRPSTPVEVYPHRYLEDFQPPDGPRTWVCLLAVIRWTDGVLQVVEDCRNPFDNLVDLTRRNTGGCCTMTVRPEDITGDNTLQAIIDRFARLAGQITPCNRNAITVCLMPGCYNLAAPLRLGRQHANLTLEGCHDGAVIQAQPDAEKAFLDRLIVLSEANAEASRVCAARTAFFSVR